MTQLAEHLANLTAFRDREVLDTLLAVAIRDLVRPSAVAIYRSVGEPGDERWIMRVKLHADDAVAASDPAWVEIESLPRLADIPQLLSCFNCAQVVSTQSDSKYLCVFPLATEQQVRGVLEVETSAALDEDARRLVDGVLRVFCNFQGLLDYSERDTLTGLLNRKTFDDSFLKATTAALPDPRSDIDERRVLPPGRDHWLGVIDIDHFKGVNDNFGHLIGDEVLLLLAGAMRAGFRPCDKLYRYGGEEFVVLMRCDDGEAAACAFERFRDRVERQSFPQVGRITVSIGFTKVASGDTPNAAFERADKAVYYAKAHGRNQVCGHADLVARGELVHSPKVGDVELF
jgi:diguanylate cyclase (GGDEF)-like protein